MHYRAVIAYKNNGWGSFSWPSFKILDLVDCDDKEKGMWETYIPVHHLMNWNIVKSEIIYYKSQNMDYEILIFITILVSMNFY